MDREDYTDPQCPFCVDQYKDKPPIKTIPLNRILEKLDEDFSKNDYMQAIRHLDYWMNEAKEGHDKRGEFSLSNEYMGIYRKLNEKEKAVYYAKHSLELIDEMNIGDSIGAATSYINCATVYKAFDMPNESIELFNKALLIYSRDMKKGDPKMAALYNNMGLTLCDLKRFDEAKDMYENALSTLKLVKDSEPEQAITYLNMADLLSVTDHEENIDKINEYVETAQNLLNSDNLAKDGNYAFVCEKCAPIFKYYGYFAFANELSKRAEMIYERS